MIEIANTDAEILACFSVIQELRPHIAVPQQYLQQVRRQQCQGYRLIFVRDGARVVAAAGYRFFETLAWGPILYVDDLITAEDQRGKGHAGELFAYLFAEARQAGCREFHLDSGVNRFAAHRFYHQHGLRISSHHFSLALET